MRSSGVGLGGTRKKLPPVFLGHTPCWILPPVQSLSFRICLPPSLGVFLAHLSILLRGIKASWRLHRRINLKEEE